MPDLADMKLWLASVSLRSVWEFVLARLRQVWGYVAASFVALVTSKAAWLAVLLMSLGGFWVGYIEGAHGKRALRSEVVALAAEARAKDKRIDVLIRGEDAALADAKTWKGKFEALQAEVARGAATQPAASKSPPAARKTASRTACIAVTPKCWPWE